ncbi:oxidoreductase [Coprinopsis cinerea okayama7|uniref:Oxidoreductase n=1 Tax=Coprinopsis cinerea (strain Okayama-7 / 130 / ATCC MYA-4618 / FGSC 9003) TaxID=240176 RepID=D6RML6_COPC7|nr:oxidoreductase [Coprinopsis cinerea okayama7\|eukprot:XP_002911273.1 oxidoreductase [Coprinopsis cinerea okayama7\
MMARDKTDFTCDGALGLGSSILGDARALEHFCCDINKDPVILKLGPNPTIHEITAPVLDWSTTPLAPDYDGSYVKILDDVFEPWECDKLIALAESDAEWKQAAVHYGLRPDQNYVNTDYRNSERILRFDHDAAEKLYERLLPYVQELLEIKPGDKWEGVVGPPGRVQGTWKLVGLNERLSFLRYGKGNYFRGHCDGQQKLPDGRMSRVTIQIYLGNDDVEGGSTRFTGNAGRVYDVMPKKGRVLIFQQRNLFHSGEDVISGTKYALRSDFMFRQHLDDQALCNCKPPI